MTRGDIKLEITYKFNDHKKDLIRTNAKKEAVKDILEEWILSQIGRGEDRGEKNEIDSYQIVIEVEMNGTYHTTSNTGNTGLTAGIITDIVERLKDINIVSL